MSQTTAHSTVALGLMEFRGKCYEYAAYSESNSINQIVRGSTKMNDEQRPVY